VVSSFYLSFFFFPRLISAVADWMSTIRFGIGPHSSLQLGLTLKDEVVFTCIFVFFDFHRVM